MKRVSHTLTYPGATVHEVFAMLGDPAYRKAVSDNQDVVDFDCQTFTKGDGMEAMPLWRCTLMPMSGPRCGRVTADTGLMTEALRVTACDTDETLAAASILFNEYRHHYGQSPDGDERTLRWLIEMVRSNMLIVYTASVVSAVEAAVIGLATAHPIPASLVMDALGSCVTFTCFRSFAVTERRPRSSAGFARRHSQQGQSGCPW
jgi:hypothetical protein